MKVWIVIGERDREGYCDPESAHASKESADKAKRVLDAKRHGYEYVEVFEMDVIDAD